jgi:hypothetical protein
MRSRLRSFDSKITFFAFADIITAVSGMLIFITLLLATDLGRPNQNASQDAGKEIQQRLDETLRRQLEIDNQNQRLRELMAAAETAPAPEKIETDIARLRSELASEQQKQSALSNQIAKSDSALQARDKSLGLTDLKTTVEDTIQEAETIAKREAKVRLEMDSLEQQVASAQSRLLKLQARDRQIWLIPDQATTTKKPILVTVAGTSATVEAFDHPEKHQQWEATRAQSSFEGYLRNAKALNQYVVFLVRPSGIPLFQRLLKSTRAQGFEVGYDALEEDRDVHFSRPPPIDEPIPAGDAPATKPIPPSDRTSSNSSPTTNPSPALTPTATKSGPPTATPAPPPPAAKNWWQRFLAWLGLK